MIYLYIRVAQNLRIILFKIIIQNNAWFLPHSVFYSNYNKYMKYNRIIRYNAIIIILSMDGITIGTLKTPITDH